MQTATNREILDDLFRRGAIHCRRAEMLSQQPASLVRADTWDRIEGMMLGLAIGDSLGNTTESLLPHERRRRHGEVRDYLPNSHGVSQEAPPRGYPSDDTQMSFWTLDQLVADRGLNPAALARRFAQQHIYGIGSTVRSFIRRHKDDGVPWESAGPASAGNGALMRIAPVLIPYVSQPSPDLWVDAVLCGMITHNDSASIASCVAFVHLAWSLLGMAAAPEPTWWLDTFVCVARQMEDATAYEPRSPRFSGYHGQLSEYLERAVGDVWSRKLTAVQACDGWYSGAYLMETVPSVIYLLMRHAAEPEDAIVRAVNDTKDNDTIGAIVGALVGALHGRRALPRRWIEQLAGRTAERDDGKVFRILMDARRVWYDNDEWKSTGSAPRFGMVSAAGIQRTLAFLPDFQGHPELEGSWAGGEKLPDGALQMPYVRWTDRMLRFVECLSEEGFIVQFPWMEWQEMHAYTADSHLLANADLATLQRLLTAYVRADRFSEGSRYGAIKSGLMLAILERLAALGADTATANH